MESDPYGKINEFFARHKLLKYKKREVVLRAGDIPSGIFYLRKGFIRQYVISRDGEEFTAIIYKPGDLFPLLWALNERISNRTFEAMTAVELSRAPIDKFITFIKSEPTVLYRVTSRILNRVNALSERMEYLVLGNAYQRVASLIWIFASRFGEKVASSILVPLPLTHKDIASLIGITRETTSIELKKLEKKNIIGYKGRMILVKKIDMLRELSLLPLVD